MNRRGFLGLLALATGGGLAGVPKAVAGLEPPKGEAPKAPANRTHTLADTLTSAGSSRDLVLSFLPDCIAVRYDRIDSLDGPTTHRITYRKKGPGAAEACIFQPYRLIAEAGVPGSMTVSCCTELPEMHLWEWDYRVWMPVKPEYEITIDWLVI